jgi:hypothetical protein
MSPSAPTGVGKERAVTGPSFGPPPGYQWIPAAATNGEITLVVWEGEYPDPDIYATRVTSDGEVAGARPGDGEVPESQFAVTRAVTIAAPPEAVWPWIVQIGYHRAGWYAYDLFDNDDIPSAEAILPEFQHLEIGQVIGEEGFAVRELEPGRHLVRRSSTRRRSVGGQAGRLAEVRLLDVPATQTGARRRAHAAAVPGSPLRAPLGRAVSGRLFRAY